MSDKSTGTSCGCRSSASGIAEAAAGAVAESFGAQAVKAQVPQSYEAKFNVRIVPGRSLTPVPIPRCQPRGHRPPGWRPGGTVAIDPGLVDTLARADKAVVSWLAADRANAGRFLADPVAALRDAGVKLSRAEEKAIARAAVAAEATRVVAPGVDVTDVAAAAYPSGRVGQIGSTRPGGKPPKGDGGSGGGDSAIGCGPRRKG